MKIMYTLAVRFRDGTGHTYNKLSRKRVQVLTAAQFNLQYDRPETLIVTTQRKGAAVLRECGNLCCSVSTGIHEDMQADGSAGHPYALTFGSGELDDLGFWEIPCAKCARAAEKRDGVPFDSYWPWHDEKGVVKA